MADNLGPMAWLFLQENVQVQYLQKIAQMRKKSQIFNDTVEANFLHEVQFSAAIEAAHFPAAETGLLSPQSPAIFSFLSIFLSRSHARFLMLMHLLF